MLKATKNRYGGIFVSHEDLPDSPSYFEQLLATALQAWEHDGVKVAWIQVSAAKSALAPVAIANGFEFHHCKTNELMLIKRITAGAYVPLPATHTIGAGGIVLSEKHEILVVLEQQDLTARPGYFKLPGGMLEKGEHFSEGVVREIYEETGIHAEFQGLISLRHHHQGQFGNSNIYAVCKLRPLTFDITIDTTEIGRAMWISTEEYLASPEVGLYNKCVVQAALSSKPLKSIKIEGYMNRPEDYEIFL